MDIKINGATNFGNIEAVSARRFRSKVPQEHDYAVTIKLSGEDLKTFKPLMNNNSGMDNCLTVACDSSRLFGQGIRVNGNPLYRGNFIKPEPSKPTIPVPTQKVIELLERVKNMGSAICENTSDTGKTITQKTIDAITGMYKPEARERISVAIKQDYQKNGEKVARDTLNTVISIMTKKIK